MNKEKIYYIPVLIVLVASLLLAYQPGPALAQEGLPESFGGVEDEGQVKPVGEPEKPLKIAVLGLENNPFWIPVKQGTLDVAAELAAYDTTVDWIVPGDSHVAAVFGPAIENALVQQYDAIATIAGDSGIVPYIEKAVEAGVPVATFNVTVAEDDKSLFFVGADLYAQGQAAGEVMASLLEGKGKVGIITGFFQVEGHELRRKGFVDVMEEKYPDIEVVGEVENEDKADIAYTQAKDFMTANPDLAGIYVTAGGPFGAARAVEEAGQCGEIKVVCFDFVEETMQYVDKGCISATLGQHPYAQGHDPAVRLYNYLIGGVEPSERMLYTRTDVVTQDNVRNFWSPSE